MAVAGIGGKLPSSRSALQRSSAKLRVGFAQALAIPVCDLCVGDDLCQTLGPLGLRHVTDRSDGCI